MDTTQTPGSTPADDEAAGHAAYVRGLEAAARWHDGEAARHRKLADGIRPNFPKLAQETEQTRQGGERPLETDPTTALLIRARGFLERGWCRWALARKANGQPIYYLASDQAVAWCAFGAMYAAGVPENADALKHPGILRLKSVVGNHIPGFNDAQETVEPVLAAFDRAIAMSGEG